MKFQIRNVRTFIAKFVGIILRNWGGQSIWGLGSIVRMKRESKKLRRNNVENVDAGECLNCTGEKMLHAIFAWGIGKAGLEKILRKLGSWIRTTGINIRRRKRCITRNIARGKLNVKCVSVELGNLIGQDIWWVGSICWGAVVEKLVVMGGVGEDEMKGKHVLLTTIKMFCMHTFPANVKIWIYVYTYHVSDVYRFKSWDCQNEHKINIGTSSWILKLFCFHDMLLWSRGVSSAPQSVWAAFWGLIFVSEAPDVFGGTTNPSVAVAMLETTLVRSAGLAFDFKPSIQELHMGRTRIKNVDCRWMSFSCRYKVIVWRPAWS